MLVYNISIINIPMKGRYLMNRIKELRNLIGFKQIELCKKLGVTQGALSGWENGKYEPDNKSLMKMADIFNVSIDYLLGRTDEKNNQEISPTPLSLDEQLDGIEFALYGEVHELSDEEKQDILDVVKFFKARQKKDK